MPQFIATLRRLLRAPLTSDAAQDRSAYAVGATQMGHMLLGLASAAPFILAGSPLVGHVVAALVWGGAWEARQYLEGGEARRVRRRWDWVADAACYQAGAAWLHAQTAAAEQGEVLTVILTYTGSTLTAALLVVAVAVLFASPQTPHEGPSTAV